MCAYLFCFFPIVGSHHWETISSAHSVLPGFRLEAWLFWEALAGCFLLWTSSFLWTILEHTMKHGPRPYAPKSANSFEVTGSKFIHLIKGQCTRKFWHCTLLSNKCATHQHVKYTFWHISVCQSSHSIVKTKCHFRSWSYATFSGFTGVHQMQCPGSCWACVRLTPRHFAPSCLWGMWQPHTCPYYWKLSKKPHRHWAE